MYPISSNCNNCRHKEVCKYSRMLGCERLLSVRLYDSLREEQITLSPPVFNISIVCSMFEEQPNAE